MKRLVLALKGERPRGARSEITPEEAREALKQSTGEDFGLDAKKWQEWLIENGKWP